MLNFIGAEIEQLIWWNRHPVFQDAFVFSFSQIYSPLFCYVNILSNRLFLFISARIRKTKKSKSLYFQIENNPTHTQKE